MRSKNQQLAVLNRGFAVIEFVDGQSIDVNRVSSRLFLSRGVFTVWAHHHMHHPSKLNAAATTTEMTGGVSLSDHDTLARHVLHSLSSGKQAFPLLLGHVAYNDAGVMNRSSIHIIIRIVSYECLAW
jgi:hypothetical protein